MEVNLFHKIKNDGFTREKKQNNVVDSQYSVYQRKLIKNAIIALFDYKCKKRYDKLQYTEMVDKLGALRARFAIQKWKSRSQKSVFCKLKARNYINQNNQKFKRMCFATLKKEYVLKSFIFKKILNASRVLNKENMRYAISQMK